MLYNLMPVRQVVARERADASNPRYPCVRQAARLTCRGARWGTRPDNIYPDLPSRSYDAHLPFLDAAPQVLYPPALRGHASGATDRFH